MTEALRNLFGRLVELRRQADSYPRFQRPDGVEEEITRCKRLILASLAAHDGRHARPSHRAVQQAVPSSAENRPQTDLAAVAKA